VVWKLKEWAIYRVGGGIGGPSGGVELGRLCFDDPLKPWAIADRIPSPTRARATASSRS